MEKFTFKLSYDAELVTSAASKEEAIDIICKANGCPPYTLTLIPNKPEKRIVTTLISVSTETDKDINQITAALTRGIYKGLDTDGIAQPKLVTINFCQEELNK